MSLSTLADPLARRVRAAVSWLTGGSTSSSPSLTSTLAVGAAALAAALLAARLVERYRHPKPPGPIGLPFVGHWMKEPLHIEAMKLADIYGDVFSMKMGQRDVVMLNSYEVIKECLADSGDLFADRNLIPTGILCGYTDDLFAKQYSEEWVKLKKTYVMALKGAGFALSKSEATTMEGIDYLTAQLADHKEEPADLSEMILKLTSGVIVNILFGRENIHDNDLMDNLRTLAGRWGVDVFQKGMIFDTVPFFISRIFLRKRIQTMIDVFNDTEELINAEVVQHKQTFDPQNVRDFIDVYIKENGMNLPDKFALTTFTFLFDAMDTLAMVLNWLIIYVVKHPEVQQKIHQELDEKVGHAQIMLSHRSLLPYVEAVMTEVLRIVTPAGTTVNNTPLVDTFFRGYFIPRGTYVIANLYAVTHDPKNFPDPYAFRPERFIDDQGRFVNSDKMLTFGIGRRKCVGQNLAKMEFFLIFSNILNKFKLSFPPDSSPCTTDSSTTIMQYPPPYKVIASVR